MILDRVHRRLTELADIGCIEIDDVAPCAEKDLQVFEKKLGGRLPGAVRELFLWGGNDLGSVFGEMGVVSLADHLKHDYHAGARETLEEAGEDSSAFESHGFIIDVDYDGQFAFIRTDEGDDPPVYTHSNDEPTFCSCKRLSDYLALLVEQKAGVDEIYLVRSLEDLDELPLPGQSVRTPDVRHIMFSGEMECQSIPGRVFAFTELRSLNMVGAGLIELTPRIGELTFLERLFLARNSLSSLPMSMANLEDMTDLDLAANQISTAIGVLKRLAGLRFCNLSGNPISPEEIHRLRDELPDLELTSDSA